MSSSGGDHVQHELDLDLRVRPHCTTWWSPISLMGPARRIWSWGTATPVYEDRLGDVAYPDRTEQPAFIGSAGSDMTVVPASA